MGTGGGAGHHKALGVYGPGAHHQLPVAWACGGVEGSWAGDHGGAQLLLHQKCQLWKTDVVTDQQPQIWGLRKPRPQRVVASIQHRQLVAPRQAVGFAKADASGHIHIEEMQLAVLSQQAAVGPEHGGGVVQTSVGSPLWD